MYCGVVFLFQWRKKCGVIIWTCDPISNKPQYVKVDTKLFFSYLYKKCMAELPNLTGAVLDCVVSTLDWDLSWQIKLMS